MTSKRKATTNRQPRCTSAYRSKLLGTVHRMMQDAHDVGAIDQTTMGEFDEMCLTSTLPDSPASPLLKPKA
jgi:DNA-binding transcriptional regulator YiaG